jgi:hypothetical protein
VARSKTKYQKSTYIEKVMREMMLDSGIIADNVKEENDERTSS